MVVSLQNKSMTVASEKHNRNHNHHHTSNGNPKRRESWDSKVGRLLQKNEISYQFS